MTTGSSVGNRHCRDDCNTTQWGKQHNVRKRGRDGVELRTSVNSGERDCKESLICLTNVSFVARYVERSTEDGDQKTRIDNPQND